MKKKLIIIMSLVFMFSIAAPAMAKGTKAPKNICMQTIPDNRIFELGIKKGIKVLYGEMKIDMYTIQGLEAAPTPIPINGTGYMAGDIFIFQMSSSFTTNLNVEGGWNVITETGTAAINITGPSDGFTSIRSDLGPCLTMP